MATRTILYMTPSVRLLGARQSLLGLAKALDPARYRPIVCCQTQGELTEALSEAGIECVYLKTGWWRKGKYWPRFPWVLWRLRRLIHSHFADLIHCNEIYPNPFACLAGRWAGVPVITHMRLSVTPRMTRNYLLRKADRIVAVSEAAGRDFDHWPDKSERVSVVYNGIDPARYQTSRPRDDLRRELGFDSEHFVAGMLATWRHRKRQKVAIEAMRLLKDSAPNVRLVLAGGANRRQRDYESEMRRMISHYGLDGRVRMMAFQSDVASLYGALDLNLLISGQEGFGRTIIEAGAAGCPSLGTRIGGIPELIRDGEDGWLIDVDDPIALADRLAGLASNPFAARDAGLSARSSAEQRFSIEAHAWQIQQLYDKVIAARAQAKGS